MTVIKDDLKYTKNHEWARVVNSLVEIGITDYAQHELGDIVFVEFPELNKEVKLGESFGTIEAVKTVADIFAPVSGKITEINQVLGENASLINSDPYGKGWIVKLEPTNLAELDSLLDPQAYQALIQ